MPPCIHYTQMHQLGNFYTEWNTCPSIVLPVHKGHQPEHHLENHPRLNVECSHHALLKSIVMGSDSISGAPRDVIQHELTAGSLIEIPLDTQPLTTEAAVVHLRGRQLNPAARLLIKEIKK